ncbi:hypothetical protein PTTG_27562 [Puccinia triticina 1-1 BBBD Race 1]|uniref:Uncharacterized protein n=1 Tax=Puccinia triticina (isolate 1-1 / race 1 (BBBD)) TaxID=630390 RepID=A0A180GIZ3_PUCT1|nr:hypothetical protein PTTG_27562 [Puccinia triticina 1-1 BBBD Race 1]
MNTVSTLASSKARPEENPGQRTLAERITTGTKGKAKQDKTEQADKSTQRVDTKNDSVVQLLRRFAEAH